MDALSDGELAQLRTEGYVSVSGVVEAPVAAAMEDRVWAWLAGRDGVDRTDRATWPTEVSKLQPLRKDGVFNAFANARTDEIMESLLGAGWHLAGLDPQALLSFPTTEAWEVPHTRWHFDIPARAPTSGLGALRCLGFVSEVRRRGGGTLLVAGSHRLVQAMVDRSARRDAGQSGDVRRVLARSSPWFADLSSPGGDRVARFMEQGTTVDGVRVRVVELTGSPGDLVLMHPWMLHNISMNVADWPRMMTSFTAFDATYQPYVAAPTM